MEWFNFVMNALNGLHIPFYVNEDFSFSIFGPVPPWLQLFVNMWHMINDNFR